MQVQTSAYGLPIPIVYGTTRIGCNLLWYANFRSVTQNSPSAGGGKGGVVGGGGKGGSGSGSTKYYADLICGLCEGPIAGIPNSWSSQTLDSGIPNFSVEVAGALGQGGWGYLSSNYPSQYSNYSGFAYVGAASYPLGTSANLPNLNFEVEGVLQNTAPGTYGGNGCRGGGDADPSQVVPDLLTNGVYGLGFPSSRIGQVTSSDEAHTVPASPGPFTVAVNNAGGFLYNLDVGDTPVNGILTNLYTCVSGSPGPQQYSFDQATGVYTFNAAQAGVTVQIRYASLGSLADFKNAAMAQGLWISPAYTEQAAASSKLDDIAKATYSEWVWSSGVLTLRPRVSVSVAGNGYTYNPPSTPLFDLGLDDFMPNTNVTGAVSAAANNDPVIVTRLRKSDQLNDVKIEFLDRANQYAPSIAEATDQALIDRFGRRASSPKSLHMFCDANAANTSAQLQLSDQNIRNFYSIQLDQRYCVLDPMDVVTLTDPDYPGLSSIPARVLEITENYDGTLSVYLEEFLGNLGSVAAYTLNTGAGFAPNFNQAPGSVNTPVLFGAPVALAKNQGLEIWCAISGSNPALYGGCEVWAASAAAGPYQLLGELAGASRMGVTTADFPAGGDPDTTDTLNVDLTESGAQLDSGTQLDADQNNTLCLVRGSNGDEYVSYEAATLTATSKYALSTYLRRGQYGTKIVDHPSGSPFVRLDAIIFRVPYQASQIGQTLYLKFPAFNIYGGGQEGLASVPDYQIALPAPPPPGAIGNFSAQQTGGAVVFGWDKIADDFALKGYDILYGAQGDPLGIADAQFLTEATRGTEMTNAAVPPGTWTFYIRARDIADQLGPVSSSDLTVTNPNTLVVDEQDAPAWPGTLSGLVRQWNGILIPDSTVAANAMTNAQLFEQYVPFPVATSSYKTAANDTGFNDTLRVYSKITAPMGRGQSGAVAASFAIDYWLTGQTDPDTWADWTVGAAELRYLRGEIVLNNVAGSVSYLSGFELLADRAPKVENSSAAITIAPGGTAITFPSPYHSDPSVLLTPVSGTALTGTADAITTTGFTAHIFDPTTGADVGGSANWYATGT